MKKNFAITIVAVIFTLLFSSFYPIQPVEATFLPKCNFDSTYTLTDDYNQRIYWFGFSQMDANINIVYSTLRWSKSSEDQYINFFHETVWNGGPGPEERVYGPWTNNPKTVYHPPVLYAPMWAEYFISWDFNDAGDFSAFPHRMHTVFAITNPGQPTRYCSYFVCWNQYYGWWMPQEECTNINP